MDEIPGQCINDSGESCTNLKCYCHNINIKLVRIKSPAEVASDQMVKWEKYIEEENIRRKGLSESHYLPKIIKEDFYRQELIIALTRINELILKPSSIENENFWFNQFNDNYPDECREIMDKKHPELKD